MITIEKVESTSLWSVFVQPAVNSVAYWHNYSRTIQGGERVEMIGNFPDQAAATRASRKVEVVAW